MNQPSSTSMSSSTKICPTCGRSYDQSVSTCEDDGGLLLLHGPDPLIGTVVLERYLILSVLGHGGWGQVYKARHQTLEKFVAVKSLHAHLINNKEKVKRFEQEAKAACDVRHDNVAGVFDFGTLPNGQPVLVMDYLDGTSLQHLIEHQPLSPVRAVSLFRQMAAGLSALHVKGIIHRDIKPSNIFITSEGGNDQVKLLDFGLAKLIVPEAGDLTQLTGTGETLGTPAYMSPEQCQGLRLDERSDIYSLGCVMYESVTGHQAFSGATSYECMSRQVHEMPPSFKEVAGASKIPFALEEIVFKAIEKDPRSRYENAQALMKALDQIDRSMSSGYHKTDAGSLTRRSMRAAQRKWKKNARGIVSGAVAMMLCVVGGLFWWQKAREADPNNMPVPQRWAYYSKRASENLNAGRYEEALKNVYQQMTIGETFSDPNKKRIALANEGLIYHLTHQRNREVAVDTQLDALNEAAKPVISVPNLPQPGEVKLVSAMLDQLATENPVDKQQLQSLSQRINDVCFTMGVVPNLKLLRKDAELVRQNLGTENLTYAKCLENIAYANYLKDNHPRALELWRQVVEIRAPLLKHTDVNYSRILGNVGSEYERLGDEANAIKYLSEAVELQGGGHEPDLGLRLAKLSDLGITYHQSGHYAEAYEIWKRRMDLCDEKNDYDAADWGLLNLVYCGHELNKDAATEAFLKSRIEWFTDRFGWAHEAVGTYYTALAELYSIEGKYQEAEAAARQAVESRQAVYTPGAMNLRRSIHVLARTLIAQNKHKEALALYTELNATNERNLGFDQDPGINMESLCKLAYVSRVLGDQVSAEKYMQKFRTLLHPLRTTMPHIDVGRSVDCTFTALNGFGLTKEDYEQMELLIRSQRAVCDYDDSSTVVPNPKWYDELSRVILAQGKLPEASEMEQKSIEKMATYKRVNPFEAGDAYQNEINILKKLGDNDAAAKLVPVAAKYPKTPL